MKDVNPILNKIAIKIDDWIELLSYTFNNKSELNMVCYTFKGLRNELEQHGIQYSQNDWTEIILKLANKLNEERLLHVSVDMDKEIYRIELPETK